MEQSGETLISIKKNPSCKLIDENKMDSGGKLAGPRERGVRKPVNNALCINLWTVSSRVESNGPSSVVTMIYACKGCYLDFITSPS